VVQGLGDPLLAAAWCGWGVTVRLMLLRVVAKVPGIVLGAGILSSLRLVSSYYAQIRGWH
jgi:hypothetical protein